MSGRMLPSGKQLNQRKFIVKVSLKMSRVLLFLVWPIVALGGQDLMQQSELRCLSADWTVLRDLSMQTSNVLSRHVTGVKILLGLKDLAKSTNFSELRTCWKREIDGLGIYITPQGRNWIRIPILSCILRDW